MTTIEEIEGVREPDAAPDATFLVKRCTALRRKPLTEFTTEDLRIMIGQEMALSILLPMAVDVLENEPLAEGDYYPGDLLATVVQVPESAWTHNAERYRLISIVRQIQLGEDVDPFLRRAVAELIENH